MAKLAHSYSPSMAEIEFDKAVHEVGINCHTGIGIKGQWVAYFRDTEVGDFRGQGFSRDKAIDDLKRQFIEETA